MNGKTAKLIRRFAKSRKSYQGFKQMWRNSTEAARTELRKLFKEGIANEVD